MNATCGGSIRFRFCSLDAKCCHYKLQHCSNLSVHGHEYALLMPPCVSEPSGHFEKGLAEGAVDPSFNPVMALRLSVLKDSAVWAILSEVSGPNGSSDSRLSSHMVV